MSCLKVKKNLDLVDLFLIFKFNLYLNQLEKCWIQPLVQEESFELNHLKGKKTFKSVIYNENTSEAVIYSSFNHI